MLQISGHMYALADYIMILVLADFPVCHQFVPIVGNLQVTLLDQLI